MINKRNASNEPDLSGDRSMLIKPTKYEKNYLCADLAAGCGKRTSICQSLNQK